MKAADRLLTFLNWFGAGLFTPVLALMLLERGCTLETLPLVMACYSAVVILCEVPSGVFADMAGRKRTFLLSCSLYGAALVCIFFAHSVWGLIPGFLLYGAARAFSSGTLDALFVEAALRQGGPDALSTVTAQLSLWQTLGLTAGAIVGGLLPGWQGYSFHLLARLGLLAAVALLCALLVHEAREEGRAARTSLRAYLAQGVDIVRRNRALSGLLLGFLSGGVLLGLIEIYWQPTYVAMATPAERPLLGAVSAAGFLVCTLGNLAIRRISRLAGEREWGVYLLLRVALTALVGFFALQSRVPAFVAGYLGIYLVVGGSDVMEQTLLNRMVPDAQRAGFLSMASLFAQLGGLGAGCAAGLSINTLGVPGLLLCGGAVVLLCAAGTAVLRRNKRTRAA